ncbi:hypothetical protein ACFVVU_33865 [Kitasatospora sp. NPDC057965]|uniref:hypothetical protein n=1 Tax=Kitasatospora sp. NPDC057965 TaxID=3346291 RepID=UPI0036DF6015
MTNNQEVPSIVIERNFPPCRCPRCGDAIPEARFRSADLLPAAPAAVPRPVAPARPYRPAQQGEVVFDARTARWGVFMGEQCGKVHLRPRKGGVEWEADPRWLVRADGVQGE